MIQSADEGAGAVFLEPDEPDLESLALLVELEELESEDFEVDSELDELPPPLLDFPLRASFL